MAESGHEMLEPHRRTIEWTIRLVDGVRDAQFPLPTPCAGWKLSRLIVHMAAQHRGFAAALRGAPGSPSDWAEDWAENMLPGDLRAAYREAAETVIAAFAEPGAPQRTVRLPLISRERPFTGAQALSIHLLDYVVHGWDVAVTVTAAVTVDPVAVAAALDLAQRIPPTGRTGPDAAFGPRLPAPDGTGELEQLLTLVGRRPTEGSPG